MKRLLIAAAAMALTTTGAAAYGDHLSWDCGNRIEVRVWKTQVSVTVSHNDDLYNPVNHIPKKRSLPLRLKWNFDRTPGKVWLNGKPCLFLT